MTHTAQNHLLLEEIGRLEAERAAIDQKIAQLRSMLPKVERIAPQQSRAHEVEHRELTAKEMLAAPPKALVPTITDHAVVRYLERKFDFHFDDFKDKLLTKAVRLGIEMGARSVKSDGGKFIIKDNKVVTYVPDKKPFRKSAKR
jgi:hypothetical protein